MSGCRFPGCSHGGVARALALWLSLLSFAAIQTGCAGANANTQGPAPAAGKGPRKLAPPASDTLDVGDALEVKVYGETELSGPQKVLADGSVNLPLCGRVMVKGLTQEQAAEAISAAYANGYLRNPQVNVVVTAFNSKKFYVLGAVNNPGVFPYEQDMNALRAIIMAGGFAQNASKNSVLITRQVNGNEVRMEVPVDDIGRGKAKNVTVLPGDIVYVDTAIF